LIAVKSTEDALVLLLDGFVVVGGLPAFIGTRREAKAREDKGKGRRTRISFPFSFRFRIGRGLCSGVYGLILVGPPSIAIYWML
jgi:hypothetical protein